MRWIWLAGLVGCSGQSSTDVEWVLAEEFVSGEAGDVNAHIVSSNDAPHSVWDVLSPGQHRGMHVGTHPFSIAIDGAELCSGESSEHGMASCPWEIPSVDVETAFMISMDVGGDVVETQVTVTPSELPIVELDLAEETYAGEVYLASMMLGEEPFDVVRATFNGHAIELSGAGRQVRTLLEVGEGDNPLVVTVSLGEREASYEWTLAGLPRLQTVGRTRTGFSHSYQLVSAGEYTMGCLVGRDDVAGGTCDPSAWTEGANAHTVTLSRAFLGATHELTQGQFEALVGYNPSYFTGLDLPVENLSWHEAANAANALSDELGYEQCYYCEQGVCSTAVYVYDCTGFRMPTEAEWEYMARGGDVGAFAGGVSSPEGLARYGESDYDAPPSPVGSFSPNGWGFYDMNGNVREWIHDGATQTVYPDANQTDPVIEGTSHRVLRGGDAWSSPFEIRSAYRQAALDTFVLRNIGVRFVRTVPN